MSETTQEPHTFRKWYAKNGADLNAKRRQRYAEDPSYRDKAKVSSGMSRQRRKERGGVAETSVLRVVDGKEIEMFRVSAVGEMIGKSPDTIRLWCRKGWIPNGEAGEHRLYHLHQIKLLKVLAETLEKSRYKKSYKKTLQACTEFIHENWA